jgi:transcription elongation factor SPT6
MLNLFCVDVVEVIIDANTTQLIIDGKYQYSDLDELIVNHIQAMSRKVEELMAFEKYKGGTEEELRQSTPSFRGRVSIR